VLPPATAGDHFGRHANHDRAATPDNPRMLIGPLEIRYIASHGEARAARDVEG
jgi:hypothetical protein